MHIGCVSMVGYIQQPVDQNHDGVALAEPGSVKAFHGGCRESSAGRERGAVVLLKQFIPSR